MEDTSFSQNDYGLKPADLLEACRRILGRFNRDGKYHTLRSIRKAVPDIDPVTVETALGAMRAVESVYGLKVRVKRIGNEWRYNFYSISPDHRIVALKSSFLEAAFLLSQDFGNNFEALQRSLRRLRFVLEVVESGVFFVSRSDNRRGIICDGNGIFYRSMADWIAACRRVDPQININQMLALFPDLALREGLTLTPETKAAE